MRTSLVILLAASLLFASYAQDVEIGDEEVVVGQEGGFEGQNLGGQDAPLYDEKVIEAQRNKLWGCFFLTKQKVYSVTPELQTYLANTKEVGQKIYEKILASTFTGCILQITPEEGSQVLNAMGSKDFSLEAWDTHVKIDLERYKEPETVDATLNPDEEAFLGYYNEMDKNLREKYGSPDQQQEEEGYENIFNRRVDTEPKIGGFSVKEMSSSTKFFYLLGIIGLIGGLFFLAYNKLFNQPETPYEQLKKKKQERKREKSQ